MKLLPLLLITCLSTISFGQVDDSLKLNQDLEEVIVSINENQSEFYTKKNHYILDIVEDSNGILVLLKNRGENRVERILWDGQVTMSQRLAFKASKFSKDCLDNFYLVKEDGYQRFSINSGTLVLEETFSISAYQSTIEPCIASSNLKLMFKRHMNHNQSILLWTFDYAQDSSEVAYWYEAPTVTRANNDQAQIIRGENYTNHARMKEISISELKLLQDQLERATFFESTLTQVPYSPTFSVDNEHYFFNFKTDSIYCFDKNFELIHQVSSAFKGQDKNGLRIMQDGLRGMFYFYSKKSSLTLFDIEKKKIGRSIESAGTHSSSKLIYNGSLYFLGKSSVDDSYNKLFKQKLW